MFIMINSTRNGISGNTVECLTRQSDRMGTIRKTEGMYRRDTQVTGEALGKESAGEGHKEKDVQGRGVRENKR